VRRDEVVAGRYVIGKTYTVLKKYIFLSHIHDFLAVICMNMNIMNISR